MSLDPSHENPVLAQTPEEPSPSVVIVAWPALEGGLFKGRYKEVPSGKETKTSTERVDSGSRKGNAMLVER
jgi:hypothetical protein